MGRFHVRDLERELQELERTDPRVREAARRYERMKDDMLSGYAENVRTFPERVRRHREGLT